MRAFCLSYLLPDKGRSSKQKTPVLRRTCSPVWNYTFVYEDVSLQELSERSLELTVWDHDRLASNEFLGGLRFNLGTGESKPFFVQITVITVIFYLSMVYTSVFLGPTHFLNVILSVGRKTTDRYLTV
jgi:hypothetical protein